MKNKDDPKEFERLKKEFEDYLNQEADIIEQLKSVDFIDTILTTQLVLVGQKRAIIGKQLNIGII